MLTLLNISNIALIDELRVELERGLNLLTGETGSGKSIIVDALGVLIGGRFTSEMIKAQEKSAFIEGLFSVGQNPELERLLQTAGIEMNNHEEGELLIRRELSTSRTRIFINHQLATLSLLREVRPLLVDIHGQGDQQTLFNPETHMEILDAYAGLADLRQEVAASYKRWAALNRELEALGKDKAEKLQLLDILQFQVDELERARLALGEDERLEEERRRLNNVEKLSTLCAEAFDQTYDESNSAVARMGQVIRRAQELAEYESTFRDYMEGLETAQALLEDLAFKLREFSLKLEFSPNRLEEVENRLAEITRLTRKYGGSIESALEHLARSEDRLSLIERADEREEELQAELEMARAEYLKAARRIHKERVRAAKKFEQRIEHDLAEVAMENARFEARILAPADVEIMERGGSESFTGRGIDRVEFYFSANVGEPVRPLARVASGGEASRLMLVLKTIANPSKFPRTIVFDEIDAGIGGRVSEAVGIKLKKLSETNQVLCVTHQPQIARFADCHLLVQKGVVRDQTEVSVEKLERRARVEEIARMLTGANITETARRHAREMLKTR
ncbi:MAG: repair protein RecN [Acidobacteriota bacterium]|jgi:DNA repair protein RecN (Recombination protein N)|nr:repair protein RecN [Acidobacteriota bacterium]